MRVQLCLECWMLFVCIAPKSTKFVEGCKAVLEWAGTVCRRRTVEVDHRGFAV